MRGNKEKMESTGREGQPKDPQVIHRIHPRVSRLDFGARNWREVMGSGTGL